MDQKFKIAFFFFLDVRMTIFIGDILFFVQKIQKLTQKLYLQLLPPANEVAGRQCFHRRLPVSHAVHREGRYITCIMG